MRYLQKVYAGLFKRRSGLKYNHCTYIDAGVRTLNKLRKLNAEASDRARKMFSSPLKEFCMIVGDHYFCIEKL